MATPASCSVHCKPSCDGVGTIPLQCRLHFCCQTCLIARAEQLEEAQKCAICSSANSNPTEGLSVEELPVKRSSSSEPGIWIFVDDSNIWIEAKKLAGKNKHFKTGEDHRVRIDVGKLTDVVADGRPVEQGFLYGSEPPAVDEVWEKIRKHGWAVFTKKRNRMTGKEKKVDTQLAVDITAKAISTSIEKRSTIIVISGDADMIPAIEKALECEGWRIEVYTWKHAMSKELRTLDHVSVFPLDDYLERVTFTNMKFNLRGNKHLLPMVRAYGVVFSMEPRAFPRQQPTRRPRWCVQLESIAQWPFQYYWFEKDHKPMDDLVLVFRSRLDDKHPEREFDIDQFIEAVEENPLPYVIKVQTFLQYSQEQSGLTDSALESVGHFSVDDVIEGSDSESLLVKDDSWRHVHRTHKQRRRPLYSEKCPYGLNCKFGVTCFYQHLQEDLNFFHKNMGRGNPVRKVKLCRSFPKCPKKIDNCQYAHGEDDAWCQICREFAGHFTDSCPINTP